MESTLDASLFKRVYEIAKENEHFITLTIKSKNFLESVFKSLDTYEKCELYGLQFKQLSDPNIETVTDSYKNLQETFKEKDLKIPFTENEKINLEDFLKSDAGKEHLEKVKNYLKQNELEKANKLYDLTTLISIGIIGKKLFTLRNFFIDIKNTEKVMPNEVLFNSIEKKIKDEEAQVLKIQEDLIKSENYAEASKELDKIKIDQIVNQIEQISIDLNGSIVKLENFKKLNQSELKNNTLGSYSSLFKLINLDRLSTFNVILGVCEYFGNAILMAGNARIRSDCDRKIAELGEILKKSLALEDKLSEIKKEIDKFVEQVNSHST